ncbi:AbrB/MazE/SpoVT family DNA-binding domain-containing protein [Anaerosolibacter sp.]|uniref:AbrB/MazE/SpoVT family DNA-binding domain-containing protein n=1 Tax=Anaerosolibacter sp. TaxID=1872527 RepID=UPI0039EDED63
MIKTKKVNKAGGVTIPSDVRLALGIEKGSAVDLEVSNGSIIVSKHTPRCIICETTKEIVHHGNHDICKECIKQLEVKANEK